jgi:hypothetical protein
MMPRLNSEKPGATPKRRRVTGSPSMRAFARAEALESCAELLTQEWTDSPTKRAQGRIVEDQLRRRAAAWRARGRALRYYADSVLGTVNSTSPDPTEEGKK